MKKGTITYFKWSRLYYKTFCFIMYDVFKILFLSYRMVDKKNKKRRLDIINDEQSEKPCKQVKLDQEPKSPANSNPIEPSSTEVNQNVTDTFPTLAEILPVVSNK